MTLGGSRARGLERPDSDWDFCLYYRGRIDAADVRALGFSGRIFNPGDWGRLLNGGAWLEVEGRQVDLLYRELDYVEHWIAESEAGRFEIDEAQGFVAGLPSYVLVGEVALGKVLAGELPEPVFFPRLRRAAAKRWHTIADFALWEADFAARRPEPLTCTGLLAKAAIAVAHARLADRGEWVFNEKGILRRAAVDEAESVLAAGVGTRPEELADAVSRMCVALGKPAAPGLRL